MCGVCRQPLLGRGVCSMVTRELAVGPVRPVPVAKFRAGNSTNMLVSRWSTTYLSHILDIIRTYSC